MSGRIVVNRHGGPEVFEWDEAEVPAPAPDEARIRHKAVGVNFIDVYFRSGAYPGPSFPFSVGMEGAGVVEAVGSNVTTVKVGDRVAYASAPLGAYAEVRNMPAARVVTVPDGIDDKTAAAIMLKGMTAEYLLHRTYQVKLGDKVLVHAAAGGVGLILCQWAKELGATVIGTVGSEAKAELAVNHGCDYPIVYTKQDFVSEVRKLTSGAGVQIVYDSVGRDTFERSLDCLAQRGYLVLYGQSSGKVEPFDPQILNYKGSLFFTRPTLAHYTGARADLELSSCRLFSVVKSGAVKIHVGQTYPLSEAARAHEDLEARRTTGSTVLLP